MGSAIIGGLLSTKADWNIVVCDPVAAIREKHASNGLTVSENMSLSADADVVVVAVKPQVAPAVLKDLKQSISDQALVISIMAGVTLDQLQGSLHPQRVIRSMPNTQWLMKA